MEPLRLIKFTVSLIILFLVLSACTSSVIEPIDSTVIVPTPSKGKSNLHGRLLSSSGEAIGDFPVRLAQVYYNELGEGAFALDEAASPAALTDNQGFYLIKDVAPSDYVLFIGSINSDYMVLLDEKGDPKVLNLAADVLLTLDDIQVSFR